MIIDFHTHIFPDKIAKSTVSHLEATSNIPSFSDGTRDGLLEAIRLAGADIAVNQPPITKPTQFESVAAFAKGLNDAFYAGGAKTGIISFAGIHPRSDGIDEKIAYLCDMGFKGIKLHPDYQDTFFDDEKYIEIIKSAKKYGLITLTHAGLDAAYIGKEIKCTPDRVLRVLDKVGGYPKLVLAHLGGFGGIGEVCEKLAGLDVYFDTAYVLSFTKREDFLHLLEKHGDDKILFASDSPWQSIKDDVERVKALGLEESSERKIFSENARKLLGI